MRRHGSSRRRLIILSLARPRSIEIICPRKDLAKTVQRAEAFRFRPWVRRAGASILLVALVCTLAIAFLAFSQIRRYGWAEEPFVWIYVAVLWLGGGKVYLGTYRPIAELSE